MAPGTPDTPAGYRRGLSESIICFATGTMIRTPHGDRRIEKLSEGDLVLTLDSGPQPIRWIASKTVRATGALAPVRFARGVLGNDRDLFVSPQHRMLLSGRHAGSALGRDQVLAPAIALVDDIQVAVAFGGMVTYRHMMFDRHQVVIANGAPSESFHPGGIALDTLDGRERDELFAIFPDLRSDPAAYGTPSRQSLSEADTRRLLAG